MQLLIVFLQMIVQLLLSIVFITLSIPIFLPIALFTIVGQIFSVITIIFAFLIDSCTLPLNDYSKFISNANKNVLEESKIPSKYSFMKISNGSFYKDKEFYKFCIGYVTTILSLILIISIITSGFWFI